MAGTASAPRVSATPTRPRTTRPRIYLAAAAVAALSVPTSAQGPRPVAALPSTCPGLYAAATQPSLANAKLASDTRPLCFRAFALLHSGVTRTPLYVAEHLTRSSIAAAQALVTRDNRFHPEGRLAPSERGELQDYRASGLDRGHMAPSGDMWDALDDYDSFSLANMVPQYGPLNRAGWADLEQYVRGLTVRLGETYVVTGPVFAGSTLRRLNGRVLVPSHLWKAVYSPGRGAMAWIVGNGPGGRWAAMSIATLASRTGIDPFPGLDAATRSRAPTFPGFQHPSATQE